MASRARLRQAKQPHGDRTPCALKQSHSHAWRSSLQLIPDWCQRLRPRSVLCLRSLCRCSLLSFPRSDPRLCLLLPCRLFAVRPSFSPNSNTHCISGRWGSGSATHFSRSAREGGGGAGERDEDKGMERKPRIPLPWRPLLCLWLALATALLEHQGSSFHQAEHEHCFRPSRPPAQARSWPGPRCARQPHLRHMREQRQPSRDRAQRGGRDCGPRVCESECTR